MTCCLQLCSNLHCVRHPFTGGIPTHRILDSIAKSLLFVISQRSEEQVCFLQTPGRNSCQHPLARFSPQERMPSTRCYLFLKKVSSLHGSLSGDFSALIKASPRVAGELLLFSRCWLGMCVCSPTFKNQQI